MALQMILQCDRAGEELAGDGCSPACWTGNGSDFAAVVWTSQLGARLGLREIEGKARKAGWAQRSRGRRALWICPACVVNERIAKQ